MPTSPIHSIARFFSRACPFLRRPHPAAPDGRKKHVLILGGGFGGIYTAMALEKTLARDRDVEITLVNRDNFFLFTPMLHEVAASDVDLTAIVSPVRKLVRSAKIFTGHATQIDLEAAQATLVHGTDGHGHRVSYDYLVLALGAETNFYGLPGVEANALTMKTLGDAIALRNRTISHLEEADTECAAAFREPLLTVVVVGGGFSGVETIGAVNDFVRQSLKFYPHIREEQVRMVLVHSGKTILPELGEDLGAYAQKKLAAQGVEIRTESRVASMTADEVRLNDGTVIPCRTVVWTAGTTPHPMIGTLPCELEKGRVKVDAGLQAAGYPNVWALGDCAVVPDLQTGKTCPPTAQHALRQGKICATNIEAALRGGKPATFKFKSPGALATIGRRTGVARVFGIKFSGFSAWFLWRTIYLLKLPRFEKKVRVALDWTLDLFFTKDLVQYLTTRGTAMNDSSAAPIRPDCAANDHGPRMAKVSPIHRGTVRDVDACEVMLG